MSGHIKYFEIGGKNMSFMTKYDDTLDKYDEICNKIKDIRHEISYHACLWWKIYKS